MKTNFKYLYIKGNNKSDIIIKTLKEYGGENTLGLDGHAVFPSTTLYYIDKYKVIRCVSTVTDEELYLSILREGKEIILISSISFPTDVYYYGNADRGNEVITALEKLGGVNIKHYDCKDKNSIYFIGNHNVITGIMAGSSVATVIKRFYKKCTLPPIEIIEIEGKKYKKEEVLEKLKNLKTY